MSPPGSRPSPELLEMVRTLADARAAVPPKQRGILRHEYGINVEVTRVFDSFQYSAGCGRLMPNLRFTLKEGRFLLRRYRPGDWESALKRAYEDLVTQSGAFASWSVKQPEPTVDTAREPHPARGPKGRKKGVFDRLMKLFIESED